MKIKLFWPKCTYLNKEWCSEVLDSYWVECKKDEAIEKIFPYLSIEQIEESNSNYRPKKENASEFGIETDNYCFLVSKNLNSIESFPWHYPYAGQWNTFCPFEAINEFQISDLMELKNHVVAEQKYKTSNHISNEDKM